METVSNDDRRPEEDKNGQKHKFFLKSEGGREEERSEDGGMLFAFEMSAAPESKNVKEPKPKVPLIKAKSLVDKRKAIISKLSNCTGG